MSKDANKNTSTKAVVSTKPNTSLYTTNLQNKLRDFLRIEGLGV